MFRFSTTVSGMVPFFELPGLPSQEELNALEQHQGPAQFHDQTSREQQGNNTWQESSVDNSDPRQISDVVAEFTIVRGGLKRGGYICSLTRMVILTSLRGLWQDSKT